MDGGMLMTILQRYVKGVISIARIVCEKWTHNTKSIWLTSSLDHDQGQIWMLGC